MNGFLIINKEKGFTSHDIVAICRKKLQIKKIGHTGTLDPMAEGLLILGINKGTKLIEYFTGLDKVYQVEAKLGLKSDTYDTQGQISDEWLRKEESFPPTQKIKKTILSYIGVTEQIPPRFSALKINGKKAYELARKGVEFRLKKREITISTINDISIQKDKISFIVHCSSGTYIRSLVNDIGEKLQCGAIMTKLMRLKIGDYDLALANKIVEISSEKILPLESILAFIKFPEYKCDDLECQQILNGSKIYTSLEDFDKVTVTCNDRLICIAKTKQNFLYPNKVF